MSTKTKSLWKIFDARGLVGGQITCTLTGDHENRITNTTVIAVKEDIMSEKDKRMIVRRLTPLECERLQGFPDGWTNIGEWTDTKGKVHKDADSPRYKALGNSIALPFWKWMAKRMVAQYEPDRRLTMGSLFDGIGGFPLVFSRAGVEAEWASEIEEFCIAVTKKRFGDEDRVVIPEKEKITMPGKITNEQAIQSLMFIKSTLCYSCYQQGNCSCNDKCRGKMALDMAIDGLGGENGRQNG